MKTQEEIDDIILLMHENFTENPDRIGFTVTPSTPAGYLKSDILIVNSFFAYTFKIQCFKSSLIANEPIFYHLCFDVTEPKINTTLPPDENEIQWAEKMADSIIKYMKNEEPQNKFLHLEPYISDPKGFRPSCLLVEPDQEETENILSALFRKYAAVKNPRLTIANGEDGEKRYFIKTEVSHKINTGYGNTLLSPEMQALAKRLAEKAFHEIKKLEKQEKQHKTKGKSRHL